MTLLSELMTIPFGDSLPYVATVAAATLLVASLFIVATNRRQPASQGKGVIAKIIYLGFFVSIAVLAVSSFASIVQLGHMLGYALLAHIASAGAFVFLLLAVTYLYLPRGLESEPLDGEHRWWVARWSAWVLVFSGIITAGTMFLSMLPILDTEGLHQAAEVHRWAGLCVVIAAVAHFFSLCCTRLGLR